MKREFHVQCCERIVLKYTFLLDFIIKNIFPKSQLKVFDFYNAEQHTESAIIRARKVSIVYPNTQQIISNSIPLKDSSVDIIFLLSAVHEIRSQEEKIQFFKECNRLS